MKAIMLAVGEIGMEGERRIWVSSEESGKELKKESKRYSWAVSDYL